MIPPDVHGMSDDDFIQKLLTDVVRQSYTGAALATIEAVASELGLSQIQGVSIREFFAAAARLEAERRISDMADLDPALGTQLLARLDDSIASRKKQIEDDEDLLQ